MITFIADAHLGRSLRDSDAEFQLDSYHAFERAVDKTIAVKASALVLAGDTTDKAHASGAAIHTLQTSLDKLRGAGIPVYFIQGNHDRQAKWHKRPIPILQAMGCINMHGCLEEIDGLRVYGLEYMPGRAIKESVKAVPECDILVLHQAFRHLLGFDGSWDLEASDIPEHVGSVVVGDVHVRRGDGILPSGGPVWSPGPLHPCDQGQGGDAGCILNCTGSAEGLSFEPVPVGSRLIVRRGVGPDDNPDSPGFMKEIDGVSAAVEANGRLARENGWELPRPVLSVEVLPGGSGAAAALVKPFADKCIVWLTDVPASGADIFEGGETCVHSVEVMTMPEALPHVADPEKPEVSELTLELLETDNITQSLASWVEKEMSL